MSDRLPIAETFAPADPAAAADAVRDAAGRGLAVYPIGGGTLSDCGPAGVRPGVALSLSQLNRIVEYPADEMTITVEAGTTIASLQNVLAERRRRFPVDVPHSDRATIGGAAAVNAGGPRQCAYGTIRDHVLGLTAVDGAGSTFSCGGRSFHTAGYNLCRMMAGSFGTLGVVTQLTLRVQPQPETSALLVCDAANFEIVERLLSELAGPTVRPAAIALTAGRQTEQDATLGPVLPDHVGRLYVGFEGGESEVDATVERLRNCWTAAGATAPMSVPAARAERIWRLLVDFTPDAAIYVLPGAAVKTVEAVLTLLPRAAVQAHPGRGAIGVRWPGASGENRNALEDIAALRSIAAGSGGKLIVRQSPDGAPLTCADAWGPPSPALRVMRAVKERFDPQNVLNPGRFVFD